MPKIAEPLSTERIRETLPGKKPIKLADGLGLFLAITVKGSKLWRFRYYIDGKCNEISLGRWPELTLAKARKKRLEYRRMLLEGIDPATVVSKRSKRGTGSHEDGGVEDQ